MKFFKFSFASVVINFLIEKILQYFKNRSNQKKKSLSLFLSEFDLNSSETIWIFLERRFQSYSNRVNIWLALIVRFTIKNGIHRLSNVFLAFGNRIHDLNSFAAEEKRNIDSVLSKTSTILVSASWKRFLCHFHVNKIPILSIVATWSSNIRRMNFSVMIFSIPFISELFLDDQRRLHPVFAKILGIR